MNSEVIDALLGLRAAANACAAAATRSGFSEEQAANGQAVVDALRAIFRPRPAAVAHTALESDAALLNILPREIVLAILHRLDCRDLGRFAATCRALYRDAPPQQESVVAAVLQERAAHQRGCGVAGPSQGAQGLVPYLLRREWLHALADQPPLLASAGATADGASAFIDSAGRLLTCGTGKDRILASPTIVPTMRDVRFRSIASGPNCCFAVSRADKVYSWGDAESQLGQDEEEGGAVIGGLAGLLVRRVDLGCSVNSPVFAAVTEEGLLYTWGSILDAGDDEVDEVEMEDPSGIGFPASETDGEFVEVPRQVILSGVCVRSVALGWGFSLILADDGRLFSCGRAQYGVLGHGNEEQDVVRPKQIEALQGVGMCGVAANYLIALALTADGRVYSWGDGPRTGHDIPNPVLLPTLVEALANERVSMVAAGAAHACAVTEVGELFTWGTIGLFGCLGHGDQEAQPTPRRVEALRWCRIATVAMGDFHTLAAAEDGSVYGFGLSSRLGLGTVSHGPLEGQLTPKRIPGLKVCVAWLGSTAD